MAGAALLGLVHYTGMVAVGDFVKTAIGVTLLLAALSLWTRPVWEWGGWELSLHPGWLRSTTVGIGFIIGLLVCITSVGSGTLLLPFLLFVRKLPAPEVVGTDILHGLVLTASTSTIYALGGHVEWALAVVAMVGALPGVVIGSHLSLIVSNPALERILGSVLLLCGIKFLLI
jgi:uncharacterized membrane protein YfcA